jgi:hypothetical protein
MRHFLMTLALIVLAGVPALTFATDCKKQAEEAAISSAKKEDKKLQFHAKNTSIDTDKENLKAYGVKKDEESIFTEIYDSKGAFVPYDVLLKKKNCKIISVKATTLD